MDVKVHISTSIKRICHQPGDYIYVLETGEGDRVKTAYGTGYESSTTKNRLELTALAEALSRILDENNVIVYSRNTYIRAPIELGWIYKWSETWHTRDGEVKNADLWERVLVQLQRHRIIWCDDKSPYASWMEQELKNHSKIEQEHWKKGAGYG